MISIKRDLTISCFIDFIQALRFSSIHAYNIRTNQGVNILKFWPLDQRHTI